MEVVMFGWFKKDPVATLQQQYEAKMRQAMDLQRGGDIPRFAEVHAEAQEILARLDAARAEAARR